MAQRKRGRETFEESAAAGKDHLACDQCRIKKVRCGKERPQCSNCTRLGTECDWSGNGKKPNQTVWLSQSITGLGDRLNQLESIVESVHTLVQRLEPASLPASATTVPPASATATDTSWLDWPASDTAAAVGPTPQLLPVLAKLADTSQSHVILRGEDDTERCFGATSLWWLAFHFGGVLRDAVGQGGWNEQGVVGGHEAFLQAEEKMRHLLRNVESSEPRPRDGLPLSGPPLVILEALIDPYFDHINPYFPIWTRDKFHTLVQRSKQGQETPSERGFAVCANTLVILTLTAKVLHSRARNQQATAAASQLGSSTDSDLLRTFVQSAHRAFANIEQLLRPTLINIQALLSLCLVAQHHLGEHFSCLALRLTVQLANAMGLHRLGASPGVRLSEADLQERQNVLYCLTFLDRSACWRTGMLSKLSPPEPTLFPTSILPPNSGTESGASLYARFALSQIQDRIYSTLYSRTAISLAGRLNGVAKESVTSLLQELEQWRAAHNIDTKRCLEDSPQQNAATGFHTELALLYFQTRTRILWPVARHEAASRMLAEDAWSCLHLFARLWGWTSEQGHFASLSRHIVSFSPMAVFHLATRLISEPHGEADGTALQKFGEFASSLQIIAGCAEADSYTATFARFVQVLLELVTDVSCACKGGVNQQQQQWKIEPGLISTGGSGAGSLSGQEGSGGGVIVPPNSPLFVELPPVGFSQHQYHHNRSQQGSVDEAELDFMTWISSDSITPFERPSLDTYFGSPTAIGDAKGSMEDLWSEYLI